MLGKLNCCLHRQARRDLEALLVPAGLLPLLDPEFLLLRECL
jgi:hypothetical protein